jgi:hypothetical protein
MAAPRCSVCHQEIETRVFAGLGTREVLARRPSVLHMCRAAANGGSPSKRLPQAARKRANRPPEVREKGVLRGDPSGQRPSYNRTCRFCGDPIRLVWLPEKDRYEPQSWRDAVRHVCSPEAFRRRQTVCPECGFSIVTQRSRSDGKITALELDGATLHLCSRKPTVRIVTAPPESEAAPPSAATGTTQGIHASDPRPRSASLPLPFREEDDERHCPSCGKLLPASGRYRSCFRACSRQAGGARSSGWAAPSDGAAEEA